MWQRRPKESFGCVATRVPKRGSAVLHPLGGRPSNSPATRAAQAPPAGAKMEKILAFILGATCCFVNAYAIPSLCATHARLNLLGHARSSLSGSSPLVAATVRASSLPRLCLAVRGGGHAHEWDKAGNTQDACLDKIWQVASALRRKTNREYHGAEKV